MIFLQFRSLKTFLTVVAITLSALLAIGLWNVLPVKDVVSPANESKVPKYVHYVWTKTEGVTGFQFHNLLSVLSVQKFLRPKLILIYILSDKLFLKGKVWNEVRKMSNVKVVLRTNSSATANWTMFAKDRNDQYLESILFSLNALALYGGIYLDNDVLIQDSMERLNCNDFTIGKTSTSAIPFILLSKKNSPFVQKWMDTFREFDADIDKAGEVLLRLLGKYPELVFVEKNRFDRKDISGNGCKSNIFYGNCNHDSNYALKLYYSFYGTKMTPTDINSMRTTFGEMARRLYYGSSAIKPRDHGVYGSEKYVVPNIVHYVWFKPHEFKFHHYLSSLSALRFQDPDKIMFHTDAEPDGKWWQAFKQEADDTLQIVHRDQPEKVFGQNVRVIEHRSDVARLEILLEYGGIYLDCDAMVVRNMDPLRTYNCSMGMENAGLNNGVILSAPQSQFLKVFYDSYKHFQDNNWGLNSVLNSYKLACKHPDLLHIEQSSLVRPLWTDFWNKQGAWRDAAIVDWSQSYVIHWMYRVHKQEYDPAQIKTMDTTFGEVARHIFYGKSDVISDDEN